MYYHLSLHLILILVFVISSDHKKITIPRPPTPPPVGAIISIHHKVPYIPSINICHSYWGTREMQTVYLTPSFIESVRTLCGTKSGGKRMIFILFDFFANRATSVGGIECHTE